MPRYEAVAHVQWEMPFPFRLPPNPFLCWEPAEKVAAFVASPAVGTVVWRRQCDLLSPREIFPDLGPEIVAFPTRGYRITSVLPSGRELLTAELVGGPDGGFKEARPYSVANMFLCLRVAAEGLGPRPLERATAALNNIIDIYRFLSLDPLARALHGERDSYYTLVSLARVPVDWPEGQPGDVLQRLPDLQFGTTIGVDRAHHIGVDSYDDLLSGEPLASGALGMFARLSRERHSLDPFHELIFTAIRRLKRFEWSLAVLDAQSAFEVLVSTVLAKALSARGSKASEIEQLFVQGGQFGSLQKRLVRIDRVAADDATAAGEPVRKFLGSPEEQSWRRDLYRLRHRIVHEGLREVAFGDAKRAVVTGMRAAHAVQSLRPSFNRNLMWSGSNLDLPHIEQSGGRLSRIFEA